MLDKYLESYRTVQHQGGDMPENKLQLLLGCRRSLTNININNTSVI